MITQRKAKTQATKQRIIDAALQLFTQKGVDATTTRHIAAAAEIAEGTLYRHFESKEALAKDLFEGEFLPFAQKLQEVSQGTGSTLSKIAATVHHFYHAFDGDVARWSYIMTYQGGPQSKVSADILTPIKLMQTLLEEGVAENELSVNDIPLMAQILVGIIEHPALGLIYEEIKGPLANSEKDVVAAIGKILKA